MINGSDAGDGETFMHDLDGIDSKLIASALRSVPVILVGQALASVHSMVGLPASSSRLMVTGMRLTVFTLIWLNQPQKLFSPLKMPFFAGLVLTSSVTNRKAGAIGAQDIDRIEVPTLILHHRLDSCPICVPGQAEGLVDKLKNAPAKKFILVEGGSSPQGDPCEAMNWHGYPNFEAQTVKLIANWIRDPGS